MLALQVTAIFFVLLSAAFMFGPQLAIYGPRAVSQLARDEQARFVGGCLTSALVLAVLAPYFAGAMSFGGSTITLVMADLATMQFSPV
nr:hypothetical protein [Hyphomonas sp. Mor2]